ncbi:MAG: chorismate synthase [Planctomycetia bacterium]|nr:chorismate synthase [Planctomycetia bacterium]
MLTYLTAGESHGKGVAALVDGFPAGVTLKADFINQELRRRQGGYGRGARQAIETDTVEFLTGILHEQSIGAPILLWVKNRDYKIETMPELTRPRPGHADLTGAIKYNCGIRPILERSSARETTGRVAAGALAKLLLRALDIDVVGYVRSVGAVTLEPTLDLNRASSQELKQLRDQSELYSLNLEADAEGKRAIDQAKSNGDTLGGVVEARVYNLPIGLGTHAQWSRKLDGRLAQAIAAIQAIKGVEIGDGFALANSPGSMAHDEIFWRTQESGTRSLGIARDTNHAGGIEGGMTNGATLVARAAMKPIPTLRKPLRSFDLQTKEQVEASFERSDACAVSAASVVVENVVAFEVAAAVVEKFGGDSLTEIKARLQLHQENIADRLARGDF